MEALRLNSKDPLRLTSFSHAGGCGCKIDPELLGKLTSAIPRKCDDPNLLVGIEHSDDAAVMRLNDLDSLVFTTDFSTPIVDHPYTYGRTTSANALSDVYAMGGTPMMANAIVGFPVEKLKEDEMQEIMRGAVDTCREAGIPLAGGHSITNPQPIFGLSVVGTVRTSDIKTNAGARHGDVLILTKPIGIGILASAVKLGQLPAAAMARFEDAVTKLNKIGSWLGLQQDVHAMTDVTGFGLAGHLIEMARGARVRMEVQSSRVPVMAEAWSLAAQGVVPGGAYRNMQAYGDSLYFEDEDLDRQLVYTDPQTNGGLLLSVSPARAEELVRHIQDAGFQDTAIIGEVVPVRGSDAPVAFIK